MAISTKVAFGRVRKGATIVGWTLVVLLALPSVVYLNPGLIGKDEAYVVLSGSMEPGFSPGDVVFVEAVDTKSLQVGDIITFRVDPQTLVTHRIVEIKHASDGSPSFRTKGDANDDADPFTVTSRMVVGEVDGKLPVWGLIVTQLRSKTGTLLFVILPCAIILAKEFVKLYKILAAASANASGAQP